MTKEELYDNYEFNVTARALKREFPFITNVYVRNDEEVNKYKRMIFFEVDINPYLLSQQYGLPLSNYVDGQLRSGGDYWGPWLSFFLKGGVDAAGPINRAIDLLVYSIHDSPAIPQELKLGKELGISGFHASHKTVPPDLMSQSVEQ